jgi:hypothetical protein
MLNEYSRELALILMKPFSHHEALLLERLSDLSEFVGICLFICSALPCLQGDHRCQIRQRIFVVENDLII